MKAKIWYKEPWMWLVVGLPTIVVVASFVTLWLAISNPETIIEEPHVKVGVTVTLPHKEQH
jgi:hypothetical protein